MSVGLRATGALVSCLCFAAAGCGFTTGSNGELGRLSYSMWTDFDPEFAELDSARIVTGHTQRVDTRLTDEGEQRAGDDAAAIDHVVTPADGVELEVDDFTSAVPGFTLNVTLPGTYTVESMLDGDVFDRIQLTFEAPDTVGLVTNLRAPGAEEFVEASASGTVTVAEGTHLSFLPFGEHTGDRLVGGVAVEWSANPPWAVVEDMNVEAIEGGVVEWTTDDPMLYVIEPGLVTVTFDDLPNGVAGSRTFDVTPVVTGE